MVERNALTGGALAAQAQRTDFHGTVRSLGSAARQHADPAHVRHHGDVGAPRAARERPQGLVWGLVLTVILGVLFTTCQAYEYMHAGFNYAGHIYGSTFFMATGFHGAHVIIGTLFLTVCLFRALAATSRPSSTSASRRPPGTGTSSTWSGCSCSCASTCGEPGRRRRIDSSPRSGGERVRVGGRRLRRRLWLPLTPTLSPL